MPSCAWIAGARMGFAGSMWLNVQWLHEFREPMSGNSRHLASNLRRHDPCETGCLSTRWIVPSFHRIYLGLPGARDRSEAIGDSILCSYTNELVIVRRILASLSAAGRHSCLREMSRYEGHGPGRSRFMRSCRGFAGRLVSRPGCRFDGRSFPAVTRRGPEDGIQAHRDEHSQETGVGEPGAERRGQGGAPIRPGQEER